MRNPLLKRFYDLIRPLFVRNWDRNEDFVCGHCGRPVLRRYLYCSSECSERGDREIEMTIEIQRLKSELKK